MKNRPGHWLIALVSAAATVSAAAPTLRAQIRTPYQLMDDEPDNVYLEPATPTPEQLTNQGGVHFSFAVDYLSTYMFRGIDQSTLPKTNEKALQFNGRLEFDLGKLPHPFIGVFSNIFNSDPVSRFEEVRPYAGLAWTIRPVTVSGGFTGYIFPNREGFDTQEVWGQVAIDDSRFFHTDRPFLNPYVFGAYDFDKYNGFYLEAGVRHDFVVGDTGLTLTAVGDFAYVAHDRYFKGSGPNAAASGLQHYDGGAILTYELNQPLHIPLRFGHFDVRAQLIYSGPITEGLRANSRLWGGVGMNFRY
jgi:hypothetical protein